MARRRRSRVRLAVALAVGGVLALGIGCLVQQRAIAELTAQRDALIESNAQLRDKINFTYTDEYFRREAHRQGYVAEDETLYSFDDGGSD